MFVTPPQEWNSVSECMTFLVVHAIQAISAVSHARGMNQLLTKFSVHFPQ